jgi:hypothetical protein
MDREGVVRLKKRNAGIYSFIKAAASSKLSKAVDEWTEYSEANAVLPSIQVFFGEKMLDLSGLGTLNAVISLFEVESEFLPPDATIIAIVHR